MSPSASPSPWISRFSPLIPTGGKVLDLACGSGRHARYLQAQGLHVTGVDRDNAALQTLQAEGAGEWLLADIENGPWPLEGRVFDAVVVTNYLWRPLWPQILGSVAPGGLLLYETFALGNAAYGKPSRPDFLLQPGELLQVCAGWSVIAYEEGLLQAPDRVVQRVAARRPLPDDSRPSALQP
ncbi:class I SAM-dependent methyltransferase [Comamonas piscis]|uniref:Class I SAM-dependent methyltransferase n=1 Tax=Comamonas piscis TaxID=1562974 RepID=A0A7G5EFY9_9BURK|nr:class I SAM-dependent methyltransferase [Comamonas piscis]QMV72914.1 class I SAM-dependent methyltransferase [Comamonas piscis]WSO35695.1 class I SAM-dependent methyltransferase [Comamonas piscis]